MWRRFAAWSWPQPVVLERTLTTSKDVMPILCPTDSKANSARNVTSSTLSTLQNELQLAANGVKLVSVLQEVLMSYPKFVCCEVRTTGSDKILCSQWLEARLIVLVRKLNDLGARPLKADSGLWIIGISTEGLGLPLVQRVVFSLLLMPRPYDIEQGNRHVRQLDPSLTFNHGALSALIQQLSEAPPCQHCSILESFGADLLSHTYSSTLDGPPSLDRLTTKGGGPAVPTRVTRDWVEVLLQSSQMRTATCALSFSKHSQKSGGVLREEDTMAFCQEVCGKLGVAVAPSKLEDAVNKVHRKSAEGLSIDNFSQFFERFLRQLSTQLPDAPSKEVEAEEQPHKALAPVIEAVEEFRAILNGGEFCGMIDVTIEDAVALQRRI